MQVFFPPPFKHECYFFAPPILSSLFVTYEFSKIMSNSKKLFQLHPKAFLGRFLQVLYT